MRRFILALAFCGAGCTSPNTRLEFAHDGGESDMAGAPSTDGSPAPSDAAPSSDGSPAVGDMTPTPADLACIPWMDTGTTQLVACSPGQTQHTGAAPGMCYEKTCGCKNTATCTGCYWSAWQQVLCP